MNNSREVVATIVGAVIGGVVGTRWYLLFTERGRSVRRQIAPTFEKFTRELISVGNTVWKAAEVVTEGWQLLSDTRGEGGKPPARYPSGQTFPF